jgi:hypothetical protein
MSGRPASLCETLDRLEIGLAEQMGFWQFLSLAQACSVRWSVTWSSVAFIDGLTQDRIKREALGGKLGGMVDVSGTVGVFLCAGFQ